MKSELTKAELVEDVARAAELTKKDAERLVEIVFDAIVKTVDEQGKIELHGFGVFHVRNRARQYPADRPRVVVFNAMEAANESAAQAKAERGKSRRYFGAWDSGDERSADNDRIDSDLASEYDSSH